MEETIPPTVFALKLAADVRLTLADLIALWTCNLTSMFFCSKSTPAGLFVLSRNRHWKTKTP